MSNFTIPHLPSIVENEVSLMNRQKRKTQAAIIKALLKNAIIKGIEQVTVQDIVDDADINRATFYNHFKDKQDLIEHIESNTLNGLIQHLKIPKYGVQSFSDLIYPPILNSLEHVKQYSYTYSVLLSPNGPTDFRWRMLEIIKKAVRHSIEEINNRDIHINNKESYLIDFVAGAHLSIIISWVENGFDCEPNELAMQISSLLSNGIDTDS